MFSQMMKTEIPPVLQVMQREVIEYIKTDAPLKEKMAKIKELNAIFSEKNLGGYGLIDNPLTCSAGYMGPLVMTQEEYDWLWQETFGEKVMLNVKYEEKDFAKNLGAKWDAKEKTWFFVGQVQAELQSYVVERKYPSYVRSEK